MDMEKRIELESRGRPAGEIQKLLLDNCRTTQISGLTDEFANLEFLSLVNVGLTTLKGFPNLPKLRKLDLSDNRISGGLNFLHGCPNLKNLILSGNKIKDLESLEPLKKFKELHFLDLLNCEVAEGEEYREKVFEQLENLLYLDGYDRKNQEVEDDDDDLDDEDPDFERGDGVVEYGSGDEEGDDPEGDLDEDSDEEGSEGSVEGGAGDLDEDDEDDDDLSDEGDEAEPHGTKRKHEAEEEEEEDA